MSDTQHHPTHKVLGSADTDGGLFVTLACPAKANLRATENWAHVTCPDCLEWRRDRGFDANGSPVEE